MILSTKMQISTLFNAIAHRYDFLNHLLSFGLDFYWRQQLLKFFPSLNHPFSFLDCATGTGDVVFSALNKGGYQWARVEGVDVAESMLAVAEKKKKKGYEFLRFIHADVMELPYDQDVFDVVTISFGLRNVADYERGLSEMKRVLRPGGQLLILEFSQPPSRFFRFFYLLYLRYMMPLIGRLFSKHAYAYRYLNQSVEAFPCGEALCSVISKQGFSNVSFKRLTFGIVSIYVAVK